MHWTDAQRRSLLNLWCRVARADGVIDDAELDRLSQLFFHLGEGVISAAEVELWLENGPPEVEAQLPASAVPVFLEHARSIMAADSEILPIETATVKQLLETYFAK